MLLLAIAYASMNYIDPNACRSNEDINAAFERRMTAINKTAKPYPPEQSNGTVIVRLTIKPDGTATNVHLISSTIKSEEVTKKILKETEKIKLQERNCPNFEIKSYPIRLQSSKN